ncbi:Snf7 [Plasmodiophora brassicae]|uniref:Uncharacterized protein n=1 Tax=Plasmodiophora brassicae TaxID=37360 RepID=A0A0G4IRU1_PLABS|nr:hypothetical protein PBRA_005930 [Plasmodiophora brassicae]SPQ98362.1 unnamed protein product [Plasmodiophora brassicae]
MNLFGKKKPPAPNMNESILKLRETINQLGKREEFLQKQADQCLEAAKQKSKKKDKRGALFELKRKKMFEKQIDQMFGKRVNLETQIFALESAATNREVITAMQHGKNAIDQSMKSFDVDNVADIMDGIDDSVAMVEDLDNALSQPLGATSYADDELEAELAELEDQTLQEELLATPEVSRMPQIPAAKAKPQAAATTAESQIDADLAELEAEFAI